MKKFFRGIRSGIYLSMIGGTLLSSGIGAYVNVVGSTELPKGVWLLVIGSVCLSISGIAIFAAANQLDSMLKPIEGAPGYLKDEELDSMWEESFRQHGRFLTIAFLSGAASGVIGAGILTYRLALI